MALGGTIEGTGLAVGGVFYFASADGKFIGGPPNASGDASAGIGELGIVADWFPDPESGWHAGMIIGLSSATVVTDSSNASSGGTSFGGTIFGGYDFFFAPQWSLGLMMTLSTHTSADMTDDNNQETGYSFVPLVFSLQGSVLFH